MTRTEQKCVIASTGIHLLLLGILMAAPAMLGSKPPIDDSQILEFIPLMTTDLKIQGGGDRNVRELPAAQTQPAPAPPPPQPKPAEPKPEPKPEPELIRKPEPKAVAAEEKKDPDSLEVAKKTSKVAVNLNRITRKPDSRAQARAQAEREAREAAEAQRRLANRLNSVVSGVRGGISGSTEIRLKGPGGGGVPYANFYDAVKSAYARQWRVPQDASDDNAVVTASVVIAKDGTVLSARITKRSGNAAVDRSVQSVLEKVKFAAPLPATETASQREVSINFDVRVAKLLLG